jgi:hypothetical protein
MNWDDPGKTPFAALGVFIAGFFILIVVMTVAMNFPGGFQYLIGGVIGFGLGCAYHAHYYTKKRRD